MKSRFGCIAIVWLSMFLPLAAQNTSSTVTAIQVPRLVRISGTLALSPEGSAVSGSEAAGVAGAVANEASSHRSSSVIGVTFALYADETGGAPLWLETQNVEIDNTGHYTVLLGSTNSDGLPIDLFTSGKAQWLGVQASGQAEQSRIMLLSVPYALKAADAETFGGKPPSAYAPAATSDAGTTLSPGPATTVNGGVGGSNNPPHPLPISGSGTTNYIALWTNASNLSSSIIYQSGSSLGIGTTTPQAVLDVRGPTGQGIFGSTQDSGSWAVVGANLATSGVFGGVQGASDSPTGTGVYGNNLATTGVAYGVVGDTASSTGIGVFGRADAATGLSIGVAGQTSTATSPAYGVFGTTSSTAGTGVFGHPSATTGNTIGVAAQSDSTAGTAVLANSTATSGNSNGVEAQDNSPTGHAGVFENYATSGAAVGLAAQTLSSGGVAAVGIGVGLSDTGADLPDRPLGVWGDTNEDGAGVAGTADDAVGVLGVNNAPNLAAGEFENEETDSHIAPVILTHNSEYHGQCIMDVSGNLSCTGSKSAVVPVDEGTRKVALYAVEAPENWFEDFGSGQLSNGSAVVHLESIFAQTINSGVEYHVFLTPTEDCRGLYVSKKTADGFEVHEIGGGTSSAGFDYRVVARRKGYEDIRLEDRTAQFDLSNSLTARAKLKAAGRARVLTTDSLFQKQPRQLESPALGTSIFGTPPVRNPTPKASKK
jgi:hypothetical protein